MTLIDTYSLTKYDSDELKGNPYLLTTSLLKKGMKGESVKWLQYELNEHGANLKIDGIYGDQTKLSVILYQKDHGLVADGICGPKTISSIKLQK